MDLYRGVVQPYCRSCHLSFDAIDFVNPAGGSGGFALPERLDSPELGAALWSIQDEHDRRAQHLAHERAEVENLLDRQRDRQAKREEGRSVDQARAAIATVRGD